MKTRGLLVFLLLMLAVEPAFAWWNPDWSFRKKISLNTTAAGVELKGDPGAVPLLLRLHTGNFAFLDAKDDGSDLRLVANDDKTALKYHIEQWDPSNDLALVWVQVPRMAANSSAEFIWLYYGNPKAAPADDSKSTYDPATLAVLHFNDKTGAIKDAGPLSLPLTPAVAPPAAGVIDGAASFNGSARITVPAAPALRITAAAGATFSAWVKLSATQPNAVVFQLLDGTRSITLGVDGDKPFADVNPGSGAARAVAAAIAPGAWHHLALTLKDKLTLYVDGLEAGTAAAAAFDMAGAGTIGDSAQGGAGLKADMDELQIAGAARPADWIRLAAQTQAAAESRLTTFGTDEQGSGGGSSYLSILLRSVTLDGWVVIGILMVMAVISWFVMTSKAMFISRTERGNRKFLVEFTKSTRQLLGMDGNHNIDVATRAVSAFESDSSIKHSPLFRLYQTGLRELRQRLDAYEKAGTERILSPQALGAIRASLDASMIRETNRLNSLIVLLTIAISGGPFLGLLGTVVGVMITFAAIAAAGDVNVNAIAPGIAAALVATVAGLAVAIPALFGYNYLSSKIKTITSDMQVFNDELISKLAEGFAP